MENNRLKEDLQVSKLEQMKAQRAFTLAESQHKARVAELEHALEAKEKSIIELRALENGESKRMQNEQLLELNAKLERSSETVRCLEDECRRLREVNETEAMKTQSARDELDQLLKKNDLERQKVTFSNFSFLRRK